MTDDTPPPAQEPPSDDKQDHPEQGTIRDGYVYGPDGWVPIPRGSDAPITVRRIDRIRRWFKRLSTPKKAGVIGGPIVLLMVAAQLTNTSVGPEAQDEFIALVQEAQTTETSNDTQVVAAKVNLGEGLCDLLPSTLKVSDWTGTVVYISTVLGSDDGTVTIELADGIQIVTETGWFSTNIRPGSELFDQLTKIDVGEEVEFSGQFVKDSDFCISETSLWSRNGLRTPSFEMEFTSIVPK